MSIRPLLNEYYSFIRHYYIIIACHDNNNGSIITYLYIIIMSLSRIFTPVITSLLPVIIVMVDHYYLCTVMTVIMDPLFQ